MKSNSPRRWWILCLAAVLSACGTVVPVQHVVPAPVGLPKGAPLSIHGSHAELNEAIAAGLSEHGFYRLMPAGGAELYITNVAQKEVEISGGSMVGESHRYAAARNYVVTLGATAQLRRNNQLTYMKDYSIEADSAYRAIRKLAEAVVGDLVPQQVVHTHRIAPVAGNEQLEQAAAACAAGNWGQGRTLAQAAAQAFPSDPECYYLLGIIEQQAGQYEAAVAYLSRALSLKDKSAYREALSFSLRMQQLKH
ncbi:MAG: hypothetical protein II295_01500 [Akkermansia sp.]|nr:hypothetical protein [Akkermansia sp.]